MARHIFSVPSSRQAKGQPTAQTPVMERVIETAKNIPGRGVVDHGVAAPTNRDWNTDDTAHEPKPYVDFEPLPVEPSPIPVYTVAGPGQGRVVHSHRTGYAAVGPVPVRIAGQHDNRTKAKIANRGTRTLWIGDDPSVSSMFGFPIPAGSTFEVDSSRAVYGVIDRYVANLAAANYALPSNVADWTLAGSNGAIVTAPWNPNRTALQLTATGATYSARTGALGSVVAGQTVYYRVKLAGTTAAQITPYVRPYEISGGSFALTPALNVTPSAFASTQGWMEVSGSFVALRDAAQLALVVGVSTNGTIGDVLTIGDLAYATDTDPGHFVDAGVITDNQPVSIYEEFDVSA